MPDEKNRPHSSKKKIIDPPLEIKMDLHDIQQRVRLIENVHSNCDSSIIHTRRKYRQYSNFRVFTSDNMIRNLIFQFAEAEVVSIFLRCSLLFLCTDKAEEVVRLSILKDLSTYTSHRFT
ncbi:hypothetical protein NPIL_94351 [Nephila pilipes]|uniref:Uncharacterized protein n=1 Tax=Nephila pilipes TaxID=299642 RepID=A0A8X6QTX8_NEPPI|nr:hypothetical protein NPIL_94351 [Nephila pilipes]